MLGKLVVFALGAAVGVIGKAIYDKSQATGTTCSDTLEGVFEGLKKGWDDFAEGFKEGFKEGYGRHV